MATAVPTFQEEEEPTPECGPTSVFAMRTNEPAQVIIDFVFRGLYNPALLGLAESL